MKTSNEFKRTIAAYLEQRAAQDETFAAKIKNPQKSIDDCCNYILHAAEKGGCAGYTDDEVYGWAIHYYDEENLSLTDLQEQVQVIVNHAVQLTAEEIEAAKKHAIESVYDEQRKKMQTKTPAKTETKNEKTLTLF